MNFSGIKNRIRKIEARLPDGDTILLEDGSEVILPPGGVWRLFLDTIQETRTGNTTPFLKEYEEIFSHGPRQRGRSLMGMTRAIRESVPHDQPPEEEEEDDSGVLESGGATVTTIYHGPYRRRIGK